jgi:hypothetical protein
MCLFGPTGVTSMAKPAAGLPGRVVPAREHGAAFARSLRLASTGLRAPQARHVASSATLLKQLDHGQARRVRVRPAQGALCTHDAVRVRATSCPVMNGRYLSKRCQPEEVS